MISNKSIVVPNIEKKSKYYKILTKDLFFSMQQLIFVLLKYLFNK
jgi:hypothetical protein